MTVELYMTIGTILMSAFFLMIGYVLGLLTGTKYMLREIKDRMTIDKINRRKR